MYLIKESKIDPAKVHAVKEYPQPTNVSEIRSFLGLANYYRRFIHDFATIAEPLHALTRKNVIFKWTSEQEKAFTTLKFLLTSTPVLATPNFEQPFIVRTDASDKGIGAVLMQQENDLFRPLCFESRKLKPAEIDYPVHEKEFLAIVYALKKWRHYLEGSDFKVITDNRALEFIRSQKEPHGRIARWIEALQGFNFVIEYKPGTTNKVADALSRHPVEGKEIVTVIFTTEYQPPKKFIKEIKKIAKQDSHYQQLIKRIKRRIPEVTKKYKIKDDSIYLIDKKNKRLFIPNDRKLITLLLSEHHDTPIAGHFSSEKTYENLYKNFYWSKMRKDVYEYVKSCDSCQRNKSSTQKEPGLLQPLPIPTNPWESISMDFMYGLPKTKRENEGVIVFVDRLTKQAHLEPIPITITAIQTANILFKLIFRNHGLPKEIVSDRDPKFTSSCWKTLCKIIGTQLNLSTSFHPQSDGQSERLNKTISEMLRHFANKKPRDWDKHLYNLEFAYNNTKQSSTKQTPFFLSTGKDPLIPAVFLNNEKINTKIASTEELLNKIKENIRIAQKSIEKARSKQKKYADKKRRELTFKEGEKVLLKSEGIQDLPAATPKLAPKYIGPFVIKKKHSELNYELDLPYWIKIHPVIHISRLKPYYEFKSEFPTRKKEQPPPKPEIKEGYYEYEVEKILGKRKKRGSTQYLIKWKGYPTEESTWEPERNLRNAQKIIQDFEKELSR